MMKFLQSPSTWVIGVLALGAGAILFGGPGTRSTGGGAPQGTKAAVTVPNLSQVARAGQAAFESTCAQCHGKNGTGTDKGPPLVHDIYNPGHHDDATFQRAVRLGTRQHHWRFGNMPPQAQVSNAEINAIISYIREIQVANGITYRRHRM